MVASDESSSNSILSAKLLLRGLVDAGSDTPPSSSKNLALEGGSSCDEDDDSIEETFKRVSIVESKLLEWVYQLEEKERVGEDSDSNQEEDASTLALRQLEALSLPIHKEHAYPCSDTFKKLPAPPSKWPQLPLMLRPTPGALMKVRGIRYADSAEYQSFPGVCAGCILPVNNGCEPPGKSLVVDFESALFVGTLLMRVKDAPPIQKQQQSSKATTPSQKNESYFDGKKRKFQVVIKGRFKREGISMADCVTGQAFDRAAGKLPARMLVNTFIKFVSTLAPQMEAELDGTKPRFLTPLVATAHTVLVQDYQHKEEHEEAANAVTAAKDNATTNSSAAFQQQDNLVNFSIYAGSANMEEDVEEPPSDDTRSAMAMVEATKAAAGTSSIAQRRQARKKAFNQLAAAKNDDDGPCFDTSKEYTFEFFQHLLELTDPDDFKINMSRVKVGLAKSLNGQPIQIMSAARCTDDGNNSSLSYLWSFDLWHQALYPYAQAALKTGS